MQEDLQRDPAVVPLSGKSAFYFEAGVRVAGLLMEDTLAARQVKEDLMKTLLNALKARWCEIVKLLGRLGVAPTQYSSLNAGASIFPSTLTEVEQRMHMGGKEAEKHFKRW